MVIVSRFRWFSKKTVALKLFNNDDSKTAQREAQVEHHIAQQNPSHEGRALLRTALDRFAFDGPHGKHTCFVYEPLREPLWFFQETFVNHRFPLPIAKGYIYCLLMGLDYLHSECNVVHTGRLCLKA